MQERKCSFHRDSIGLIIWLVQRKASVPRFAHKMFLAFAGVAIAAAVYGGDGQQPGQVLETRVKASFLYTFAKYVEWPAGTFGASTNAFVIGVLGRDPFGETLDSTVAGKNIDGHPVRIQRFQRIEDVKVCHVLFVSRSEKDRLVDIEAHLRGHPVLTVSDMDKFLEGGGQIQFISEDSRVKFDIDLNATKKARLTLNANLLRVARRVIKAGTE